MTGPGPADSPIELARRIAAVARAHAEGAEGRAIVALDHDGTLSPIAPRPEAAGLAHGARAAIDALTGVAEVVIVSGRGLDDLERRMAGLRVHLVSEHGLRHRDPEGALVPLAPGLDPGVLDDVRALLRRTLPPATEHGGWLIEDKGVSLAVHHRLVAPDALEPTLTRVVELLTAAAARPPGGHVQHGKAVVELRPLGADKGAALGALAARRREPFLVMVGDDLTDEPALALAESTGGVGVLVAEEPRRSAASARLRGPEAVVEFVAALAQELRRGRSAADGTASRS